MDRQNDIRPPSDVRSSPSGRVPQWVLDEAMGIEVPVRRGPTATSSGPSRRRTRSAIALVVVGLAAASAWFFLSNENSAAHTSGVAAQLPATPRLDSTSPPPGREERGAPLGVVPSVPVLPEGSGFRFAAHQRGSAVPVTWSPCRPIHYVTRPANSPADGAALLHRAVAAVSAATGLRFEDDGTTSEDPSGDREAYQPGRYGSRWAPVLVAWATPQEVPDFGIDVEGEAGANRVTTPQRTYTYVSGVVYLDAAKLAGLEGSQGAAVAQAIVMHELGHLVGLGHVDDASQVMFPGGVGAQEVTDFAAGDRAGLALLGRGPCQPGV